MASNEDTASFFVSAALDGIAFLLPRSATKHVGVDPQILRNPCFADAELTCQPDCLAPKLISKLPSLHLTPPIVKS
jgi:hypothetical protein